MTEPSPETLLENLDELSKQLLTSERLQRFDDVAAERLPCLTAAFENLYDDHNVSAGIRSCEVFGCADVHVINTDNPFNMNHSTASNATRWVNIHRYTSTATCIDTLHEQGFTVVGTLPEGRAVPFMDFELPDKLCIFMGQEHAGMTDEAIEMCDAHVTIPQFGFTQSLNISVALAILIQHYSAAYRASGRDNIHLPAEQKKALIDGWRERDLRKQFGWQ